MSPTIGKVLPTIGKVSPTIDKIDRRRIDILINKIDIVSDHGRQGFADWFCLSAIGIVSPTMVFVSTPNGIVSPPMFLALRSTALCLRPWFLFLCECRGVFDHGYCFSANVVVSSIMVFASLLMSWCLRPR
jgi:hypothetical protein